MENNDVFDKKNVDTKYKEVKINKMIVNGKEQAGNIISTEDSKEKQELNVTVYTQELDSNEIETKEIKSSQKIRKGISMIHELFKKRIFHHKRN